MEDRIIHYLRMAVEESAIGMEAGDGGPFGCIIVKGNAIVGRGHNRVLVKNDPTAHAEIEAIRQACAHLQSFQLEGCEIYCSCEPCPMCLGAIYWARPAKVYYANTRQQAAEIGFDDEFIYREVNIPPAERSIPMHHQPFEQALKPFEAWQKKPDKDVY